MSKKAMKNVVLLFPLASMVMPTTAFALGWSISDEANAIGATQQAQDAIQPFVAQFVRTVTNWAFWIAIGIFVLRVALTAIDRMVLTNQGASTKFHLSEIPVIGAYPDPVDMEMMNETNQQAYAMQHGKAKETTYWTWKHIWGRFAIQVAITAGVWAFINILLGIVVQLVGLANAI